MRRLFLTIGIIVGDESHGSLLARTFSPTDTYLVNEATERNAWVSRRQLGKRSRCCIRTEKISAEMEGIVKGVRYHGPNWS